MTVAVVIREFHLEYKMYLSPYLSLQLFSCFYNFEMPGLAFQTELILPQTVRSITKASSQIMYSVFLCPSVSESMREMQVVLTYIEIQMV